MRISTKAAHTSVLDQNSRRPTIPTCSLCREAASTRCMEQLFQVKHCGTQFTLRPLCGPPTHRVAAVRAASLSCRRTCWPIFLHGDASPDVIFLFQTTVLRVGLQGGRPWRTCEDSSRIPCDWRMRAQRNLLLLMLQSGHIDAQGKTAPSPATSA